MRLLEVQTLVGGMKNTGKTFLAEALTRKFKRMVYTKNVDDKKRYWRKYKSALVPNPADFKAEFPFWCKIAKMVAAKKQIQLFIVDDADVLFRHHYDTSQEVRDLVSNLRHYKLGLFLITHRIQDIPARLRDLSDNFIMFADSSPRVRAELNNVHDGFGDLVADLDYTSHEFYLMELGKNPVKACI